MHFHFCFSFAMKRSHDETTDWSLRFICQKKSKVNLRSASGIYKLSYLLEFYRLGSLKINISRISTSFIGDDPNIKKKLEKNSGLYHHDCASNYKNRELEGLKKRLSRQDPAAPSLNSHVVCCHRQIRKWELYNVASVRHGLCNQCGLCNCLYKHYMLN